MNSFKDQLELEVGTVFANEDEFWDMHKIDGNEVSCMIDKEVLRQGSSKAEGVYCDQIVLYVKENSLKKKPVKGSVILLDHESYFVCEVAFEVGLLVVTLEANES